MMPIDPVCCMGNQNQIYNPIFTLPDITGSFPDGWQKCAGSPPADIIWQTFDGNNFSVMINNPAPCEPASICQLASHKIPVMGQQTWEAGALFMAYDRISAFIIVHFINSSAQDTSNVFNFCLVPGLCYYSQTITIPYDIVYVYLEIGTKDVGQLLIEDVIFAEACHPVCPPHPCTVDVDTVETVETVKRVVDPVKIEKIIRDFSEDVTAEPVEQTSRVHDVLRLNMYTFSVINLGTANALVHLQTSPDKVHFVDEPCADDLLLPGQLKIMTTTYFLRYGRLKYWTNDINPTPLRIFFQGQG